MNKRFGERFSTTKGAAKFVLNRYGKFHGLDVVGYYNDKVMISEECGQLREKLSIFFPEFKPYFKWHLNDLHAECEHQELRGESWTNNPGAICLDCGYELGSAWLKRELPQDVIDFVKNFQ